MSNYELFMGLCIAIPMMFLCVWWVARQEIKSKGTSNDIWLSL